MAQLVAYQRAVYSRCAKLKAWRDLGAEVEQGLAVIAGRTAPETPRSTAQEVVDRSRWSRYPARVRATPTEAAATALLGVLFVLGLDAWVPRGTSYTKSLPFRQGLIAAVSELTGEIHVVPESAVASWRVWFWGLVAPLRTAIAAGRLPGLEVVAVRVPAPVDPVEARAKGRALRIAKAERAIRRWTTKAKLAATKIRRYRASLAALSRAQGVA